ncbi:leucine-rich repeat extensin-like protein 5 [Equus quagga]|uniref:leucine-rich repeat extensin-like protein 5 n=1 Tax=Equus quagga TaxID=89248 RepID=UPI001EE22AC4|nr:leucine-rich repeat extensin-like protein 5 [Equus quagga]
MPWTLRHGGQCQRPLITSDPTSCVNPCGTRHFVSIWDSPIQGQPVVVPMEWGSGQGAGQTQPDSFSHPCSTVADPCLSWEGPARDLPPSLCRGRPPSVQGALGTPEDTPGSREHPPHSLRGSQLTGSPACPPRALLQEPLVIPGSYGADPSPAAKQERWVPMGLQTQETYRWVRGRAPSVQHPGGRLRDAIPEAPQLSPFPTPDSKDSSPGTGSSHSDSPAEPTRQSKDRLAIPAPSDVSRLQGQPSTTLPHCPPDPAWPPASMQSSHDLQLQIPMEVTPAGL